MTKDEIKEQLPMPDVMRRYGVKINRNMCRCPFHGKDNNPSMKVFNDGAVCFACNWNGDIFKFVMDFTHCSFKEAYLELGGEYASHSDASKKLLEIRRKQQQEAMEQVEKERQQYLKMLISCINILQAVAKIYEPHDPDDDFFDEWVEAQNQLPYLWELWEEYAKGGQYNLAEITRKYSELRERYID